MLAQFIENLLFSEFFVNDRAAFEQNKSKIEKSLRGALVLLKNNS